MNEPSIDNPVTAEYKAAVLRPLISNTSLEVLLSVLTSFTLAPTLATKVVFWILAALWIVVFALIYHEKIRRPRTRDIWISIWEEQGRPRWFFGR